MDDLNMKLDEIADSIIEESNMLCILKFEFE